MTEQVNDSSASVNGDSQETVESLKARLAELDSTVASLNSEATKHKALRRQAEKERDEFKTKVKTTDTSEQDYKQLWQQTNDKLSKTLERAKKADINTALSEQFNKSKVSSDKFGAALKLVDHSLIEWNEDEGIDGRSITAAVQKLKSEHGFLFESMVAATDPKTPGDASSKNNTITRTAFEALSPMDKAAKMKSGIKLID